MAEAKLNVVSTEDAPRAIGPYSQAVRTGKTDAGVNDNGLLNYFVSQNDDVEVVTEFETGEEYGFSVKKGGNDELLAAINDGIASDDYDAVYEKWFGTAPSE